MVCPVVGGKSYAHLVDETDWGELPGSPSYYFMPLDSNGLAMQQEFERAQPFVGLLQQVHKQLIYAQVAGQISCGLFGWDPAGAGSTPLARKMLEWGFADQEESCPRSKWMEWAEGPDVSNGASSGLRCNSATLTGSADNGAIGLTLDLLGKVEAAVATAQVRPDEMYKLTRFVFRDVLFELDLNNDASYATQSIKGFSWNVQRNLAAIKENSVNPVDITANGPFAETFQFTLRKTDATYDTIRRTLTAATEFAARLTLKGLHMGTGATGNYAKVVIAFPRLSFTSQEKPGDKGTLSDVISCDVLKPGTSANGHTMTWSEVA